MATSFGNDEVKEAIFSMHPNKSSAPDGLNPAFFQKNWGIVGLDVTSACISILEEGVLTAFLSSH